LIVVVQPTGSVTAGSWHPRSLGVPVPVHEPEVHPTCPTLTHLPPVPHWLSALQMQFSAPLHVPAVVAGHA
jgi:hypothetical protein